jgi:RNA polymerase sigma factor (sigma-70 family)
MIWAARPQVAATQSPSTCPTLALSTLRARLERVSTDGAAADSSATPVPGEVARQPAFVTTRWSVVITAGRSDTTQARAALEKLCQTYWYPLYAYVRRRGHSPEDAQDLTQEFFARLLERNWVATADRQKGKFRSFLLSAMNHFLADEWDKARAQKRGGGLAPVPLKFDTAETRYGHEPVDNVTPEQSYERRWALTLLEEVLYRLRSEYEQEGRAKLFAALHPCLVGDRTSQPYAELAVKLGVTEGTVKSAVHRLRQRYRQLLRDEIAHTVAEPGEVNEELQHLFRTLSR